MSVLDRQRSGPQRSNTSSANFGTKESAANYNFLGGQQQMSGQQPGLMQSLTRQQTGISDAQMLQQQVTMKQMQDMQRQQQLQHMEAMQRNSMNQMPLFSNQGAGHSAASFINGSPMHDASNYPWSSQVMSGGPNWLQHGPSHAMQGYTNGVMMPPVHGQSVHMMGLNSQQAPPSLYGVPVSNSRSEGGFLMNQVDKTGLHQVPHQGNFPDNQHPVFAEQMNMRGGSTLSRQGFEGKGSFEYSSRQGSANVMSVENFNEMKQRSLLGLDGRHDIAVSHSMSLPDQSTNQAASSHAPVGLDPTEEKILFGDDDNIWEAFGGSLSGSTTAVNQLDGAFPSLQSGSWSALMQSAVAESASSDTVVQAEWKGVGVQNSGSLTGKQQPPKFLDCGEQPAGWFDRSSMAQVNSRPSPDTSLGSPYHNSGLQKSLTNQGREGVPSRPRQQTSEEGKKWSDRSKPNAIAEESQNHESDYCFRDFSSKSPVNSWNHQQRTSSMENRPGGLNFIQTVSNHGLMSRDQEKFLNSDGDRGMNLNIGDGGCKSILSAGPDSNAEIRRHHINSKDDIRMPDNNHQQEFWRSVSSDNKSEVDGLGMYQQHLNKGNQRVLHSSTSSYDRGRTEIPETGSSDKRENSSDSYSSNLSNRASTGRMRDSVWLDAGDAHGISGGKHNSSGQGDVRVSYGISPSQIHPGYVSGTPKSFDISGGISTPHTPISSSQNMLELLHKVDQSKDHSTLGNLNSNDRNRQSSANETEASGRNAAFSPAYSFSSQGFGLQLAPPSQGLPAPNFLVPSQNMSRTVNSPSPNYVVSDKGDKSHAWLTQAGSGQSISSVHDAQQGGAQANRSDVPWHIHESLARNIQGNFPASFPSQSQHLKGLLHNQPMANPALKVNHPGNASFDWQAPQDKQMTSAVAQRVNTPSPSTDHSDTQVQLQHMTPLDISSSLQPSITSDMYQKGNLSSMIPNMRTNMTMPQQLLPSQSLNATDLFKNQFQLNNIPDTSASVQQKQESRESMQKGDVVVSQNLLGREEPMGFRHADATQKTAIMLQGKETLASSPADASNQNSAATKEDIQAFGRSLKPNSNMVDNYSLLHQMQARKEMDPNVLQVKRFKGSDNFPADDLVVRQSENSGGLNYPDKNASSMNNSISSLDANMPSFMPVPSNDQEKHNQQQSANTASHDLLSGQGELQKGNAAVPIAEQSQISLQMAPTWFKQFGTFKNGQMMPVHDVQRAQLAQNTEQQLMLSKSSKYLAPEHTLGQVNAVVDAGQKENVWQNIPQVPAELMSSNVPLAPTVTSLRPKKRKKPTLDLLPWHKEVAYVCQSLPSISSSEEDWAQSAHRLIEKVEDEFDVHEDVSPVVRSKRRLVLTTQLMQQIFCPPPASILSLDVSKEFETVAYFTARSALADACSLTCQPEKDSCATQDKEKLPCEESKANDGIHNQYLKKLVEGFINRAKTLDNDLPRLDKRVSVLDLRLECQDLERFSVINRFARFHGRGQADGTETSSSSDAIAAPQRARPQRYVNAYTAPKNLPDRVQCLSL
ncbi:hypothetical protein V2J09_016920 [Rumex salicifolius]